MAISTAEKIRTALKAGQKVAKIAEKYDVSTGYVYSISWKMKNKGGKAKRSRKSKANGGAEVAAVDPTAPVQLGLFSDDAFVQHINGAATALQDKIAAMNVRLESLKSLLA
jgi:hypothetical protein